MIDPPRQTRSFLTSEFERRGLYPRHDLGQNFLVDLNLHDFIVEQADLQPHDVVLEVGTGTGALTSAILMQAGTVVSVEYDRRMHELAREMIGGRDNVVLLNCDALKNKNRLAVEVLEAVTAALDEVPAGETKSLKLVANLPYNVATPVISNLIATELPWTRMVVTIQYELAERMAAEPGASAYSALTVWLQSQTKVSLVRKLGPAVFWPRPQVDSAIVRIDRDLELQSRIADREFFHSFVRDVFTQRRKRLRGVIANQFKSRCDKSEIERAFEEAGISLESRAEQLAPAELVALSNSLRNRVGPAA
jgi:16S rRNA (adenine1518-N6/adenine1519-N6)-dimethyltransferase